MPPLRFCANRIAAVVRSLAAACTLGFALNCLAAPTVSLVGPARNVVAPGQSVVLQVTASGSGALSYQWSKKGKAIVGATSASLAIGNAAYADSGWYVVDVTDTNGVTRSAASFVIVAPTHTQLKWLSPNGEINIPEGLDDTVDFSSNANAGTWALRRDGSVIGWYSPNNEPSWAVPDGLTDVVQVAAGYDQVFALKSNGTVAHWGSSYSAAASVPADLTNVVAISANYSRNLALKADGTVVEWGVSYNDRPLPALTNVSAISCGSGFSLALKNDGTVVAWGSSFSETLNVPADLSGVVAIATGAWHSVALKSDGTVVVWGSDSFGSGTVPSGLNNVVGVSAGTLSCTALRADGTAISWGHIEPLQKTIQSGIGQVIAVRTGEPSFLMLRDPSGDPVISKPTVEVSSSLRQVLTPGQTANFSVTASGTGTLSYQWIHNGFPIAGATATNLSRANVTMEDGGWYAVRVTDANGTTASSPMFATIAPLKTRVRSWGRPNFYNVIPTDLNDAVAVAGGTETGAAIMRDGSIRQWLPYPEYPGVKFPAGISDAVALSSDYVLRANGQLVAGLSRTVPVNLKNVVSFKSTQYGVAALRTDGTVVVWDPAGSFNSDLMHDVTDVAAIAISSNITAVKNDGTVFAWGRNTYGKEIIPVPGLSNVVAIADGPYHVMALQSDGTMVFWGRDDYKLNPPAQGGLQNARSFDATFASAAAVKSNGEVVNWALDTSKQILPPSDLGEVLSLVSDGQAFLAIRNADADTAPQITVDPQSQVRAEDQNLILSVGVTGGPPLQYVWRKNGTPIAGATASTFKIKHLSLTDAGSYDVIVTNYLGTATSAAATITVNPVPVVTAQSAARQILAVGQALNLSVTATGTGPLTYQWLHNFKPVPGATGSTLAIPNVSRDDAGHYIALITDSNGTRRSAARFVLVGSIYDEIVGWSNRTYDDVAPPLDTTGFVDFSAGASHVLALRSDGTIVGWLRSDYGATTAPAGLGEVVAVDAGASFSHVLRSDGTVARWGYQSGYSTDLPTDLTEVVALATGNSGHTLALRADGTVVAWGYTEGDATIVPDDLSDVIQVAAGGNASLALKANGTVVAWGTNAYGQCDVPTGLNNVKAISLGTYHALALKNDGTVVAWGANNYQQCAVPAGLGSVVAIAAGNTQSLALKADGTTVTWGQDALFAVNPAYYYSGVRHVYAGSGASFVMRDITHDGPPSISASPTAQVAVAGGSMTMNVTASGNPLAYQWMREGANPVQTYQGGTRPSLVLSNLSMYDAGKYYVRISNGFGTVTSAMATLTIVPAIVTVAPANKEALTGTAVTFTTTADSHYPLTYQWRKNGVNIAGATNATYTIDSAQPGDAGSYTVVATNSVGSVTSSSAVLTVKIPVAGDYNHDDVADAGWANPSAGQRNLWLMGGTGGTTFLGGADFGVIDANARMIAVADFDGDSHPDILWQNLVTGERYLWLMNGSTHVSTSSLGTIPVEWSIAAAADFNADGKADILWQNTANGERYLWYMDGSTRAGETSLGVVSTEWSIAAAADFNADGKPDILWQNTANGERYVWFMNGSTQAGGVSLGFVPKEWSIIGAADFNGDGKPDLLWQHTTTGEGHLWYMNGVTHVSDVSLGVAPKQWTIAAAGDLNADGKPDLLWQKLGTNPAGAGADFNGDGKADILWQNTANGERYLWFMNGSVRSGEKSLGAVPTAWSIAATADFNADGKLDLLWQNTATGERYVWFMNGSTHTSDVSLGVVPTQWSIVAAADFNGDGKPDILWQNTANGERYVWFMNGTTHASDVSLGVVSTQWSIAAAADFNSDSKPDLLWQNTATGERYVWFMNGTTHASDVSLGVIPTQWSIAAAADYNGDGKPDMLWQNSATGERFLWFMNGTTHTSDISLGVVPLEWQIVK